MLVTLVSLQQMVLFGKNPSQGTLLKASQFLAGTPSSVWLRRNVIHGRVLHRGAPRSFGSPRQRT